MKSIRTRLRRAVVISLEWACGRIDDVPGVWWYERRIRFVRHAQYGCWPLRLAQLAMDLDTRWGTDVWGRWATTTVAEPITIQDEGYIDLDEEVVLRKDGSRITEAKAESLGQQIAHRARARRKRR